VTRNKCNSNDNNQVPFSVRGMGSKAVTRYVLFWGPKQTRKLRKWRQVARSFNRGSGLFGLPHSLSVVRAGNETSCVGTRRVCVCVCVCV
jgi:hypothetical protein